MKDRNCFHCKNPLLSTVAAGPQKCEYCGAINEPREPVASPKKSVSVGDSDSTVATISAFSLGD